MEILFNKTYVFDIYALIESHVPQDAEGDRAGQEAGGGVDQAGDDGVPVLDLVKLSVFHSSSVLVIAVTLAVSIPE